MTNQLRSDLRKQILLNLRIENAAVGEHVPEKRFAFLGTSRGPIRAALLELADEGVLRYQPNKGYFVRDLTSPGLQGDDTGGEESTYRSIAADRLAGLLPETVTINEVMRRYDITKALAHRVFGRIEREGWAERRAGRGFSFTAMVDTPDAYQEIYEIRRAIEPAGILSEKHVSDMQVLEQCRAQQEHVLSNLGGLDQGELFVIQSSFHERIMAMSNNRFFIQTLHRVNSLRRLATYRQELDLSLVERQSSEHIQIIDRLLAGDRARAADLMTAHLGGDQRNAVLEAIFPPGGIRN